MAVSTTVDFFESQDAARKKTFNLVVFYILAVVLIILGVYFAFAAAFLGIKAKSGAGASVRQLWNPTLFLWVAGCTVAVVIGGMAFKINQLSDGGEAVARLLGGRPINRNTQDPYERKVLNVVEEMAIASGTPVPRVFLLDNEDGINAFAAGFTPGDAVVGVTRGCIELLSRDELQGVIAHEFSHILNGDMRLNIRLIGVLNGILIIGLVGYWIFRSSLYSSGRSRSRQRGNNMPIFLLGLFVMAIGYIGVFFGKLIKSAVSRQREFLADASAVQFTRNPPGIAGALKKIGGFARSSEIMNSHAEEASHLFFSNGLAKSFANLMATHPPLEERIRRIEPSFDGIFQKVSRIKEGQVGLPPEVGWIDRFPARETLPKTRGRTGGISQFEFAIEPNEVVRRVGTPQSEHLTYASGLVSKLPSQLADAVREPFGARAVIYSLLLNREGKSRDIQLQRLSQNSDAAVYDETLMIAPAVENIGQECRLPLADLAISALKELSDSQYENFRKNVRHLVEADEQIDLFEYTLQRMIIRHLEPVFHKFRPPAVRYYDIKPLLPKCANMVSCLAYWGTDDVAGARKAFACGAEKLPAGAPLEISLPEACGLQALDDALDQLVNASPKIKKLALDACTSCIGADGRVTVEEAELLRAVADSLDCPIPPFLPSHTASPSPIEHSYPRGEPLTATQYDTTKPSRS